MKDYTDYMDNISVDTVQHENIMKRITQKPTSPYRNRTVYRFAGLTACAATLLICVWLVPGLFNTPTPNIPDHPGVLSSNEPQSSTSPETTAKPPLVESTETPGEPGEKWQLYPLTLNKADSIMQTEASWAFGCFDYDLTDKQLDAVFPNADLLLAANAFYSEDGRLLFVTAVETLLPGKMEYAVKYDEVYTRTEIKLGEGAIVEDCVVIYEDTPQISDVNGIPVTAYMLDFIKKDEAVFLQAEFMLSNVAYRISIYDNSTDGQKRLTEIVNSIIINGAADLTVLTNPIIPEMRHEQLTFGESRLDPDFGAFIPATAPSGFAFENAYRTITQRENSLSAYWNVNYDSIHWQVSMPTEYDREHIVLANESEKYDLSLYPIPRADSVPSELREYVDNPVFLAEELTLEIIKTRAYQINDAGDTPGWRMDFSVLYDDAIVYINTKGVSPEWLWETFEGMMN